MIHLSAVVLSVFDPIRREIARVSLERLIDDGRIHPARIEEIVEKAKKEMEVNIKEAGEQATFDTGIHGVNHELVKLLGKLKYRTSYDQNVLQHSLEVASFCGIIASELGINVKKAKRAGLLHDIGKAVDHDVEGSHAFTITPKLAILSELFYPRLVSSAGDSATGKGSATTGIALVNTGPADARLVLRAFNRDGKGISRPRITNPLALNIAKSEQRAIVDSQLFGPGLPNQNAIGWIKLESSQDKLAGFSLTFDYNLNVLDGADVSSDTLTSFVFPEIEDQGFSQISIVNPSTSTATVRLELRKSDGSLKTPAIVLKSISPSGVLAEELTTLFADTTPSASDYIRVTSDKGVAGFQYLGKKETYAEGLNAQAPQASAKKCTSRTLASVSWRQ